MSPPELLASLDESGGEDPAEVEAAWLPKSRDEPVGSCPESHKAFRGRMSALALKPN